MAQVDHRAMGRPRFRELFMLGFTATLQLCVGSPRGEITVSSGSTDSPVLRTGGHQSASQFTVAAEREILYEVLIYGHLQDRSYTTMAASTTSATVPISAYLGNNTSGTLLGSLQTNSSRSHLLTVLSHTTTHFSLPGQSNEQNIKGSVSSNGNEEDGFGEHYFHICIYIWACLVVSSLIALSVKWGCCGRSLTRWEVKRIPLKRFQKIEGDEFQEKCPICHEEFHEGRLIRQLPCNHRYHSYCVDRWLVKMSNRCPLCKQRVSISLFCPWNKQQHKKDIHGQIIKYTDADSLVDDSPPLPPLASLTPRNWYGEAIMSGPSKFIIMRPGKPTRVIDVQEQRRKCQSSPQNCRSESGNADTPHVIAGVNGSTQKSDNIQNQTVGAHVCDLPHTIRRSQNTLNMSPVKCGAESDNITSLDVLIPSSCSSRSCSVCSDQPLLLQQDCGPGNEITTEVGEPTVHGYHSVKCSNSCECSPSKVTHNPFCDLANNSVIQFDDDDDEDFLDDEDIHSSSAEATVTLSSGSSSVVSFNIKSPRSETTLLNPSTSVNQSIIQSSGSLELPTSLSQFFSSHNKRHTYPEAL